MKVDIFNTENKYKIIYADPPWQFLTYSEKGKGRSADRHYNTMAKSEIQKLPISQISEGNLEITNISLRAGYDGAEKNRLYWVDKYKEAEHHAEVAERALKEFAAQTGCNDCPYRYRCSDFPFPEAKNNYQKCFNFYLEQAEKELAEERKDD